MTGNKTCASKIDPDINRSYCFGDSSIRLGVSKKIQLKLFIPLTDKLFLISD